MLTLVLQTAAKSNPNDEDALRAIDLLYDTALVSSGFTVSSCSLCFNFFLFLKVTLSHYGAIANSSVKIGLPRELFLWVRHMNVSLSNLEVPVMPRNSPENAVPDKNLVDESVFICALVKMSVM